MLNDIYIRVDGSAQIGLGHLIRSLALAQMLEKNFQVSFFSKVIPEKIIKQIKACGFTLIEIQSEYEFFSKLRGYEIVILDNYFFDTSYQKRVKEKGSKLVYIDDLQDKEFYADVILCQIPKVEVKDYKAQIYTEYLLGIQYVLLRPAFQKAARIRTEKKPNTLFICFGGADYNDLTKRSLEIALTFGFEEINIVVGLAYVKYDELIELARNNSYVKIHQNLDEIRLLEIMTKSSLAIVPSSGILLEVFSAGCRVISGYYIDNQKKVFEVYKNLNLIISAEDFSVSAIEKALSFRNISSTENAKLIDGYSSMRIQKAIHSLSIEDNLVFRRATIDDLEITYKWATDITIRRYSYLQHEISLEEHRNWFNIKIIDPKIFYYIVEYNKKTVGSIRYDCKGSEAIISYLIDPEHQGNGYGQILLKMGLLRFVNDYRKGVHVVGFVMKENIASVNIFEKAGYIKSIEIDGSYKYTKIII